MKKKSNHQINCHCLNLILSPLQVQTLTRTPGSLNLSPPPPLILVIPPWFWMLSPPCEERCSSSRAGNVATANYKKIFLPTDCLTENWLYFSSCVSSFFWRSHPQTYAPQQSLIRSFWPSAPINIDAAYENEELDTVFFFKGVISFYSSLSDSSFIRAWVY